RPAVRRAAQRLDRPVSAARLFGGLRLHAAVLPDPRAVPGAQDDVLGRPPAPARLLGAGPELRQDDANHRQDAVPGPDRGVQRVQQPDVRRARLRARHQLGGLRPDQPQHDRAVELPALHPAGIPIGVLTHTPPPLARPKATSWSGLYALTCYRVAAGWVPAMKAIM